MRVLHVNKYLYRKGGAEGYMEDTAALQVKAGHEVGFWGMAHPDNTHTALADTFVSEVDFESPPPGVVGRAKVVGRMLWSTSARAGIERAVERFQPDVAHLHNVYHQLSPSDPRRAGPPERAGRPDAARLQAGLPHLPLPRQGQGVRGVRRPQVLERPAAPVP